MRCHIQLCAQNKVQLCAQNRVQLKSIQIFCQKLQYNVNLMFIGQCIILIVEIKIDQFDVTCFIITLFTAQHVSNVSTFIFRSLRLIVDASHGLYFSGLMCVGVTVWLRCGILMQAEACIRIPHHPSRTTCRLTANVANKMKHRELFYSYIVGLSDPAFSVTLLRRCIVTMFDYRHF